MTTPAYPMKTLTQQAHEWIESKIGPGDIVVDATSGNGHDTQFLAMQVGKQGTVFAFDIQPAALEKTSAKLAEHDLTNVRPLLASHSHMLELIPAEFHGQIAAIMFNLGYLPGGDKSIVTRQETTKEALQQALLLLKPGGVLSVLAYVGHPGGQSESREVQDFFEQSSSQIRLIQAPDLEEKSLSPRLFLAERHGS